MVYSGMGGSNNVAKLIRVANTLLGVSMCVRLSPVWLVVDGWGC